MKSQSVKDEFSLRFYQWALTDFYREVYGDFPLLGKVKGTVSSRVQIIMKSLPLVEQIKYASILVRRAHKRAVEITGEQLDWREERLWQQRSRLLITPNSQEMYPQQPTLRVNQKRLRELVRNELKAIGEVQKSERNLLDYRTALDSSWEIYTSVRVGGPSKLDYFHLIRASTQEDFRLGPLAGIDMMRWFGVGGTTWDLIGEEDYASAANSLAVICTHLINAAPSLVVDLNDR